MAIEFPVQHALVYGLLSESSIVKELGKWADCSIFSNEAIRSIG